MLLFRMWIVVFVFFVLLSVGCELGECVVI